MNSLMQLFQLRYMKNRGRPGNMLHFSEYMTGLVGELEKIPNGGDFWKLSSFEKAAFNLAMKRGLM